MVSEPQLQTIEREAQRIRCVATQYLAEYGFVLDDAYACLFTPAISLPFTVGLVTGGPVEAQPNLTRLGERLAGVLEIMHSTYYIYYEAYDLFVRQRFSIAHELGHFVLHAYQGIRCACSHDSVDPQRDGDGLSVVPGIEQEADAFAAAMLMPLDLLTTDVVRFGRSVAFLAARYQVSEPAMRRRLRRVEQVQL